LIIPVGLERDLTDRPVVAPVVLALLVYQFVLGLFFPGLAEPAARWAEGDAATLDYWRDFALCMVRGPGSISAMFLCIFWMILGPALEIRVGAPALVATLLLGSLIPWLGLRAEWLAWETYYWPGLGGMMACLGLAYYAVYDEDICFYYFFFLWWGRSSTGAALVILLLHFFLGMAQYAPYSARLGESPPPGLRTILWINLWPFAATLAAVVAGKLLHIARAAGEEWDDVERENG
jgi:hypothetical protein